MKLLTLNTHSLQEENYEKKLDWFTDTLLREHPDLVALQEVNQTEAAPSADPDRILGMVPVPGCGIPVRTDNHAAEVAYRLRCAGICCSWVWLPIKVGYGKYDEGIALISLNKKIAEADVLHLSSCDDYHNWRTRKVLGVRLEGENDWFYSIHMGWWDDAAEPFRNQWQRLENGLLEKKKQGRVWLLGDFNSPAQVRGEGYDLIRSSGWNDTFLAAKQQNPDVAAERKDVDRSLHEQDRTEEENDGNTIAGVIDGWREKVEHPETMKGMRIDHIWCSREIPVKSSKVIFDGKSEPQVSDHFGILLITE